MVNIRKILKSEYKSRFPKGERLGKVARLVNWEAFRPMLEPLFKNTGEGRPHTDVVLMTKVLVLQSWYGLSDEQAERDCKDRITFMNFLGYPAQVPDARTIWLFKERIAKEDGKEKEIWQELQRQLDSYRVKVKQGQMKDAVFIELGGLRSEAQSGPVVAIAPHTGYAQDSTIIEADSGAPTDEDVQRLKEKCKSPPPSSSSSSSTQPASENVGVASTVAATAAPTSVITKPRGDTAKTTRSKDGTWTQKRNKSYFGFKLHTKAELNTEFISDFEVTTASVHDNNVDLTHPGEVCVRDRGYSTGGRGLCVNMIRATRGHPLTQQDKELNRFLSGVRAPVEHPFSVMKRVFHAGRVLVTTIVRVKVRMLFVCTCYNLSRALTLSELK